VGTFHIADPENWIALLAFLITAMTAGQLSSRAKLRADEATAARQESERLYQELQETFEQASEAKALKRSERLKSALLDAVTHDLRTPLTSIKASVTTMLDDQRLRREGENTGALGSEGRQEMLEVIDEESDRLNSFIEGLMALARIEAGEMDLRREWGSLEEIVKAAILRASPLTRNHHVELRFDKDLPSIRVDERAVAEVVYVLLENAAKYSPPGVILLSARPAPEDMVRLTIEDQGPGIPAELHERVFDKFFRAMRDGDLTGEKPGTGMGLAIAKGIIEAHGGRMWAALASPHGAILSTRRVRAGAEGAARTTTATRTTRTRRTSDRAARAARERRPAGRRFLADVHEGAPGARRRRESDERDVVAPRRHYPPATMTLS